MKSDNYRAVFRIKAFKKWSLGTKNIEVSKEEAFKTGFNMGFKQGRKQLIREWFRRNLIGNQSPMLQSGNTEKRRVQALRKWRIEHMKPLEDADIDLVHITSDAHVYCKNHGAMLTVNMKVWRCMGTFGEPVGKGAKLGGGMKVRANKNACRAGCVIE